MQPPEGMRRADSLAVVVVLALLAVTPLLSTREEAQGSPEIALAPTQWDGILAVDYGWCPLVTVLRLQSPAPSDYNRRAVWTALTDRRIPAGFDGEIVFWGYLWLLWKSDAVNRKESFMLRQVFGGGHWYRPGDGLVAEATFVTDDRFAGFFVPRVDDVRGELLYQSRTFPFVVTGAFVAQESGCD